VLQFDAQGDDVEMDARFEYHNIDRWDITPSTMNQVGFAELCDCARIRSRSRSSDRD